VLTDRGRELVPAPAFLILQLENPDLGKRILDEVPAVATEIQAGPEGAFRLSFGLTSCPTCYASLAHRRKPMLP